VINDILDLAKAEAGKLTLEEAEIDLGACIADCVSMCRVRADERGVVLTMHVPQQPVFANVDRRLITQVAINLLSNAIKFTEAGGTVSIALAVHPRDGIVIAVSDTGIGIAQEDMDRILKPFEQVENAQTRSHEGTGLGLPLAKRIVELHGGVLTVSSMLGRGTTVYARLPKTRLVQRRLAIENAA
jgi:signal transduction histidine kinase